MSKLSFGQRNSIRDFDCDTIVDIPVQSDLLFGRALPPVSNRTRANLKLKDNDVYDICVIGGGLLGCFFAAAAKVYANRPISLCIVDPFDQLMCQFFNRCEALGLSSLRSGLDQHLAPDGLISLEQFSMLLGEELGEKYRNQIEFSLLGQRSLADYSLFKAHARYVCDAVQLENHHFASRIEHVEKRSQQDFLLTTECGTRFSSKSVVAAMGGVENVISTSSEVGEFERRVFDSFSTTDYGRFENVAVVGSGLTAASRVMDLLMRSTCNINWITRSSEINIRCFDFPEKFLHHSQITAFSEQDERCRSDQLSSLKTGSITPEYASILERELGGRLSLKLDAEVKELRTLPHAVRIDFAREAKSPSIFVDAAFQCTGIKSVQTDWSLILRGQKNFHLLGLAAAIDKGPSVASLPGGRLVAIEILRLLEEGNIISLNRRKLTGNTSVGYIRD
jgi:hypothetical protein